MKRGLSFFGSSVFIFSFWVCSLSCFAQSAAADIIDSSAAKLDSNQSLVPVLRPVNEMFESCSKCHTIGKGKLIGPDLLGVENRHSEAWLIGFIQSSDSVIKAGDTSAIRLYLANEKIPMPDHDFSKAEIQILISYIVAEGKKLKANPDFLDNSFSYAPESNNWWFILALCLIILPILDLFFTRFFRYRILHVIIIIAGFGLMGKVVTEEAIILGRSLGYEPDQPIKFSHKVHAGENQIKCDYCHTGVYTSRYASIPPAALCLNCHTVIRSGTNTGEEEIDKIHNYVEQGKAIPWVKVYNLPDFVFFSHAQHVRVGKVDCEKCHGDVTIMGRLQQATDMSMGWCVECHRQTAVDFTNKYYTTYKQQKLLKEGKISRLTVDDIGGNNCQKCHY